MYCQQCGIHNTDDTECCQICNAELANMSSPEPGLIYSDLTQFPLAAILAHILKNSNVLLWIISIPIISITYVVKKLSKQPFLNQHMNSKTPKLHPIQLDHIRNFHPKAFRKASSFLQQQGFKSLLNVEDVSMTSGVILHLAWHPDKHILAALHFHKQSGRINEATFSAFFSDNSMLAISNTHALPIQYPSKLRIYYHPKFSLKECYEAFQEKLQAMPETPVALSLRQIMQNNVRLREYSVKLGLSQGLLHTKSIKPKTNGAENRTEAQSAPVSGLSSCYHHPGNIAVRSCSICGTALCEACYTEYQERWFCERCRPAEANGRPAVPPLPTDVTYAGFGVRLLAFSIDLFLLGLLCGGIYFATFYGTKSFIGEALSRKITFLLTQISAAALVLSFYIPLMNKYGGRPGQRILGLRIVDKRGEHPELEAAIVRLAYLLIASLFLFPWLGYLFIPFKKTKQGLHDRLAGTFVITKRSKLKTMLSWLLVLCLCGGIGWQVYVVLGGWFSYLLDPSAYSPEISLKARWVQKFEKEEHLALTSLLNRGTRSIVTTAHSVYAVNMLTGETLWQTNDLPGLSLQTLSKNETFPLLGLQHDDGSRAVLVRLHPESGAILWKRELEGDGPRINFDDRHIAVFSGSTLSLYNLGGEQLWRQNFQDGFVPRKIVFHRELLVERYSEEQLTLTYLKRENGDMLWQQKTSEYSPGYTIPDLDQQIFYTKEGEVMLFDVRNWKKLWDAPRDLEYIIGHTIDPRSGQIYLHSTKGMVRQRDGELHFSYPAGFRLVADTDDYLMLLEGSGSQQKTCLLLDKSSGKTVQEVHEREWFALFYLSENGSAIYLAANTTSGKSRDHSVDTLLIRLDKQSWEIKEIPVGRNIGLINFKVFPEEGLVFIPLYQHIGGYLLPEM